MVQNVLEQARVHGVDLRVVPDMYDGLAWNSPIEYIGQFPTIPLHCGHVPELGLLFKRVFDIVFSGLVLMVLSPLLLAIAIAVKLDSPGPVLYFSERIGKKGRVFRCIKFRTMVRDADKRRADVMHMNERDGVLFKIIQRSPHHHSWAAFCASIRWTSCRSSSTCCGRHEHRRPASADRQRGEGVQAQPPAPAGRDAGHYRPVAGAGRARTPRSPAMSRWM